MKFFITLLVAVCCTGQTIGFVTHHSITNGVIGRNFENAIQNRDLGSGFGVIPDDPFEAAQFIPIDSLTKNVPFVGGGQLPGVGNSNNAVKGILKRATSGEVGAMNTKGPKDGINTDDTTAIKPIPSKPTAQPTSVSNEALSGRPTPDNGQRPRPDEDQRPNSRPDFDDDHRRPNSRPDFDDDHRRPNSRPDFDDDRRRPNSRPDYDDDRRRPNSRPDYDDDRRRPNSRPDYDDYYRPNSRLDYDDDYMPNSRLDYEDDYMPNSRLDYDDDYRPNSRLDYDDGYRPNSRPDYDDDYHRNDRGRPRPNDDRRKPNTRPDNKERPAKGRPNSRPDEHHKSRPRPNNDDRRRPRPDNDWPTSFRPNSNDNFLKDLIKCASVLIDKYRVSGYPSKAVQTSKNTVLLEVTFPEGLSPKKYRKPRPQKYRPHTPARHPIYYPVHVQAPQRPVVVVKNPTKYLLLKKNKNRATAEQQ